MSSLPVDILQDLDKVLQGPDPTAVSRGFRWLPVADISQWWPGDIDDHDQFKANGVEYLTKQLDVRMVRKGDCCFVLVYADPNYVVDQNPTPAWRVDWARIAPDAIGQSGVSITLDANGQALAAKLAQRASIHRVAVAVDGTVYTLLPTSMVQRGDIQVCRKFTFKEANNISRMLRGDAPVP
jgi:hypothetical protein